LGFSGATRYFDLILFAIGFSLIKRSFVNAVCVETSEPIKSIRLPPIIGQFGAGWFVVWSAES